MPLPSKLHACGSCGYVTGCTEYGSSWVCGRASCILAAMRRHLGM